MGLLEKAKPPSDTSTADNTTNRNMGLLLVFFPEGNSAIADKTNLFSSPSIASSSSSSSPSRSPASSFRRRNSSFLLSKAQSTISICALFIFITLLLFTLSTFEPSNPTTRNTLPHTPPRRFLSQKPPSILNIPSNPTSKFKTHIWLPQMWRPESYETSKSEYSFPSTALQRMGTLYRRGTRAMSDLLVAHVVEDTTDDDIRLFLRVLHRSGLTARADVVFIFASASSSSRFASIIQQENDFFTSLIDHYTVLNLTDARQKKFESKFDAARFFKVVKKGTEPGEPLWGKKSRSNFTNPDAENSKSNNELTRLSYGSVLSFDATELDPENSLAGFLDHVPLRLRRWACYPMLLGRVRRNFKHVMLVDAKNLVVTNDPLGRVRDRRPESVFMYSMPESKHKKISDRTRANHPVDSAVVMGGERGIRRLSNAMLIGIVRAATQHKNSVSESAILSQLVSNGFVLKNVNLITSTESIPDASSLGGRNAAASTSLSDYAIIQRGPSNGELNSVVKKQLCSSYVEFSVYRDC